MKGAIDMYRKISPDLVVATNRGGAFSIGAIVLMSYLAFVETWAFVGSGDVREKIDVELGLSPARINIDHANKQNETNVGEPECQGFHRPSGAGRKE